MSASHGNKAVIAAFFTNSVITVLKLIAGFFSGSASLVAEALHSVAVTCSQLMLLLGNRLAPDETPKAQSMSKSREHYVWAFIAALVLFAVSGLFSIYRGVLRLQDPLDLGISWVPLAVFGIAIVLVSLSLRAALAAAKRERGESNLSQFMKNAKSPALPVVVVQEIAALVGLVIAAIALGLSILTGNPVFDALGSLLVGVLLVAVAIVLANAMQPLLIGESASSTDEEKILRIMNDSKDVEAVIHMKSMYLSPGELLVGAKVAFPPTATLEDVARTINSLEHEVREQVPVAKVIYIEPDIYIDQPDIAPSTDLIVIQSGN